MSTTPLFRRVFTAVDIVSDSRPETEDEKRVQIIFKVDMPYKIRPQDVGEALMVVKLLAHSAPLPELDLPRNTTKYMRIKALLAHWRVFHALDKKLKQ